MVTVDRCGCYGDWRRYLPGWSEQEVILSPTEHHNRNLKITS